ncbi:tRNA pseudouridine(55) synthase TruB [uncultured Eubacterium sp.]|uniref:tRNA pseudouridine(55) synthase TruB n=1 Tax=uncultured Eubacterium sp. TaxID=165185 RepID=UPI00280510A1|nr:tRNA pseudouridine(55) synthase TruB [uncultured Eubacterium sp.]
MTGIICVNKEKDITSFGVVAKLRGITGEKKAGHTGTLDPMATGVLPVMFGGATRFLNFLPDSDKGYRATFKLGMTTDTLDITGEMTSQGEVAVNSTDVKNAMCDFVGVIDQIPPMFSAKSVDGVRLYDLAREGKTVEREACKVEIKKLELAAFDETEHTYQIDVLCSKGTYIRSLIDDIGKKLGCGAVMTELVRTKAMGFDLSDCITLAELQERKDSGKGFDDVLIDIERMFDCYKKVRVSPAQSTRFFNGGALDINRVQKNIMPDEICAVYSDKNEFLGLGQRQGEELKVLRVLSVRE